MKSFFNEFGLWWKYTKQAWKIGYNIYPLMFMFKIVSRTVSMVFMGTLSIVAMLPFLKEGAEPMEMSDFEKYYPLIGIVIILFLVTTLLMTSFKTFFKKKEEEIKYKSKLFVKEKLKYVPYFYAIDSDLSHRVDVFEYGINSIFSIPEDQIRVFGNLYTIILASAVWTTIDPFFLVIIFIYIIISFVLDFYTERKNIEHELERDEQNIRERLENIDYELSFPMDKSLMAGQQSELFSFYKETSIQAIKRGLERFKRTMNSQKHKNYFILFGFLIALGYAYFQLKNGSYLNVVATLFLLWKIVSDASMVSSFILQQDYFKEQSKVFEEILLVSEEQKNLEEIKKYPEVTGSINILFDNISLKYPHEDDYIFKDFSETWILDRIYGLEGANGAGKTTIFRLLLNQIEPTSGSVYINGINVKEIKKSWFQDNFAIFDTDMNILEGLTLAEFLTIDKLALFSKKEQISILTEVVKQVGLNEKIPTKKITNLVIGSQFPEGTGFSAGQKQRLLIARMLVNLFIGAKFVLIDEMTSNIAYNDQKFFAELIKQNCIGGIIIAHNPIILDVCDITLSCEDQKVTFKKSMVV